MASFLGFLEQLTYSINPHNPLGLFAIFALGFVTDIGVPLPFVLEGFLFFASYRWGPLSTQVLLILAMLLSGRELAASSLYSVARKNGDRLLDWMRRHLPRIHADMEKLRPRLVRNTAIGTVVVRLTPGLLQLPAVIAGSMRLPFRRFLLGVAIGSLIYDFGLIIFGYVARVVVSSLSRGVQAGAEIGFLASIIAGWAVLFIVFRRQGRQEKRKRNDV